MNKTNDKPVISIILLSLMRQPDTMRCIESIVAHTSIPYEVIVVDMASSTETCDWLEHLAEKKENFNIIFNTENVGTTRGRNQGISLARGKYIVFLDNDAEVTAGWIEQLLDGAESSPEIAACGSKVISASGRVMNCAEFVKTVMTENRLKEIGLEFTNNFHNEDPKVNHRKEVPWYPTTCLLVKRSVLDIVGGFDENIFLCEEDKDLCLRMVATGNKILYVPGSVVYHHHNPASDEYSKIRNKLPLLVRDIKYFEQKWHCRVFIRHSRTSLHKIGMNDHEIDRIKKFSFFHNIIEEKLRLNELILTVTNRCNHQCGMCYYHEHLNVDKNELSIGEYQKIAASLEKLNILWISGGEPFLRSDLHEICKVFVDTNKVDHIFIPTNGSNPDKIVEITNKIIVENPEVRLTLMFSMEGRQELHDTIHGKSGAFASVEQSIKKLIFLRAKQFKHRHSFGILLNSVVTSQNIHDIIPLMEYARNHLMIDSHSFTPMRGQGRDESHQPPSGKELLALYEQANPFFDFYTKRSKQPAKKTVRIHEWMNRRYNLWVHILDGGQLPFDCQAGNFIGVLEPDGGVRICELKPVAANVRDYGYNFPKAWFSAMADKTRETKHSCSCTHACFLNASV
ncbi:MAG: glycosyltransferase [Bacteroidia bacterium]|nr:glycosyltransferase [Bacteroidia bacterium]